MGVFELRPESPEPRAEPATFTCVACGSELAPSLGRLGSIRCHDCRVTYLHVPRPDADEPTRRRGLPELPWLRRREGKRKAA